MRHYLLAVIIMLLSCSTTKYALIMDEQVDTHSSDQSLSAQDELTRLNINDLASFAEVYEYTQITLYHSQEKSVISFDSLNSILATGIMPIDSIQFSNGNGVTSSSFLRGFLAGIFVFAVAPVAELFRDNDDASVHVTYSLTTFAFSLGTTMFLSIGADLFNKNIMLYPIRINPSAPFAH